MGGRLSVVVDGNRRVLRSPSGHQTVSMVDGGRTGLYYDIGEEVGLLRPAAKRVVMLGLGGGEMLRAVRRSLPDAELIGVDDDARVIEWATGEFSVGAFGVTPILEDAREWLERQPPCFADVLLVDVYEDSVLPPRFMSPGFFAEARRRLPAGLLVQNVWPAEMGESVASVATAAWPDVRLRVLQEGNAILFAG